MLRKLTLLAALVALMSLAVAAVAYAETFVGTNGPDRIVGTDSADSIDEIDQPTCEVTNFNSAP